MPEDVQKMLDEFNEDLDDIFYDSITNNNKPDFSDDPEMQAAWDAGTPEQRMMTVEDWLAQDRSNLVRRQIALAVAAAILIGIIIFFVV